jgi:DNA repair protein SbcC/Rad50
MIEEVKLLNFISHSETELKFRPGVTVFVGRNGSGKSSVIDGITYALYGKHTRSDNQNLVRRGSPGGYASVAFSVGSRHYLAERKLSKRGKLEGSVLKELADGTQKQLAGGERKQFGESLSDEISKVIGLDYQRMQVAAIIQQGELDAIIDLTPGKLKDLINELIGIDSLGVAYESMRDLLDSFRNMVRNKYGYDDRDFQTISNNIAEKEELFQSSDQEFGVLALQLESLRSRERQLVEEQGRFEPLKAKAELMNSKTSTLVDYVSREVGQINDKLQELGEVVEKATAYLRTVSEEESIQEEAEEARKRQKDVETDIEERVKQIAALEALEGRPSDLLKIAGRAGRYLETVKRETQIRRDCIELPAKLKDLESRMNGLKEQRGRLAGYKETAQKLEFKDGICPLCGSKVERINELFDKDQIERHIAEHDEAMRLLQAEKDEIEPKLESATKQLAELEESSSFLAENHISSDSDVKKLEQDGIELAAKFDDLPALKEAYVKASKQREEIKTRTSELDAKNLEISLAKSYLKEHKIAGAAELNGLTQAIQELQGKLEKVPQNIDELRTSTDTKRLQVLGVDDHAKQLLVEIGELESEASRFDAERYEACVQELDLLRSVTIAQKVGEVESCRMKRDTAQKELYNLRQTLVILQSVTEYVSLLERIREKVFHRDGPVSSSLRSWALKEIGVKATEYARLFGIGISSISFTEKARDIDIECYGPRGEVEVESLSGGEKVAIALALRFAMAYVMGGYKLDFIILDEPTVHLDDDRKASLVEIISRLGRLDSPLKQMIIITHDEEIFENAEIDAVFRFEASSEGTKVSLEP